MIDFAQMRRMMVDGQVRTADVTDLRLLAALLEVPRERFVPASQQAIAYLDLDIPLAEAARAPGRRLLRPMVLAKLIQAASVRDVDRVLDVACATGYSTAVLARLCAGVVALEEDEALAEFAAERLAGLSNVRVASGPLAAGRPEHAPYDLILLNGAIEIAPRVLLSQLKDGGRLVGVVGGEPVGKGTVYRAAAGRASPHPEFDAAAPLLPGFAKPAEFVF